VYHESNSMKRAVFFFLLLLAGGGILLWYYSRPKPIPVILKKVERGRVEASVANTRVGTVKACRRSGVAPAVGGQVAKLNVKEGDRVKEGQLLLEIWNKDLTAALNLAGNEANAARARTEEACVLAEVAQREAERQVRLKKMNLVADEQVDRAVTEAKARAAVCQSARANIQSSEARVAEAAAAKERTILRAPFDGVVAEVNAELGEYITPSPPGIPTSPAVDLIDDSCLYVTAPIDEVDAPAIRVGMNAFVTLDAFPQRRFPAHVRRIAPYVLDREKQARTVEVEVELERSGDLSGLLEGYSADVEVVLDAKEGVLRLPTAAVLDGSRLLVYREGDGRLEERTFERGLSNWDFTEIVSGVSEGERVVVSVGREGVEAGVRVVPEAADESDSRSAGKS
jgi:HlyD family secretion protein